jgi:hypothetical protein
MDFNRRKPADQRREVMYFKHDFSELKGRSSIGLASNGGKP